MAYTKWDLFIYRYTILINVYTYINDVHPHVKIALSCTCMCFVKDDSSSLDKEVWLGWK